MKKTVSRIGIDPQYLRKGRFKRMNFRLQALYFCLLQYVDHAGCWDIDLIDLEEDFSSDVTMLDLDKLESAGHILFDDTKTTLLVTNFIESHYNGKPSPTNSKHYPFFKVIEERRMFVSEDMSSISFQMNENEAFKVETVPWSNYGHKSTKLAINLIHKQSLKELCFAQPSTAKHSLAVIREDIDKDKIREEEKRDIKGEEKQPLPKSESMAQLEEALEEEKPETASKYVEFKEEEQDPSKMSLKAINFEVVSLKRALNGKTPARKKKTLERLNSLQSEVKARRVCFTVDENNEYQGADHFLGDKYPVQRENIKMRLSRQGLNYKSICQAFENFHVGKDFYNFQEVLKAFNTQISFTANRQNQTA